MKSFRDINGTTWDITGGLSVFERVKTQCSVDLLDLASTQHCLTQLSDPYTLGHVLYQLCAAQAESRGIAPEKFYDLFNGDTLREASNAILEEVVFFCPSAMRPGLTMALEKAKQAEARMAQMILDRMDEVGREMDAALASTNSATSLRGSSGSTQANGRSAASSGRPGRRKKNAGVTPARL